MWDLLSKSVSSLFPVLFIFGIIAAQDLDYQDLQFTGGACPPRDTCNHPVELLFQNRSCECDNKCSNFADCCIDAPSRLNGGPMHLNFTCLEYVPGMSVYTVSKCPRNQQVPENVRIKCEDFEDLSNSLAAAPTTDLSTNITYKNHYCAHCNNANRASLRSWQIGIECDELPVSPGDESTPLVNGTFVEENIIFLDSHGRNGSWGFYYPENTQPTEGGVFYPCYPAFRPPDSLNQHIRFCRPNLISSCAPAWRRSSIKRKCEAYMAVVYVGSNAYRNPHCATCNFADAASRMCSLIAGIDSRDKKAALSFTLLMDVNTNGGNRVGEVSNDRCQSNQNWDPFAKKCRPLVCGIPGYQISNGMCVPISK